MRCPKRLCHATEPRNLIVMADQPGHLWRVIQSWLDVVSFPPSQNKLAERLGVSGSALGDYKYGRHMPSPEFLEALAQVIAVPYETVLDAALRDAGYRPATITGRKGVGKMGMLGQQQRRPRRRGRLTESEMASAEAEGQAAAARQAGASAGRTARARQDAEATVLDEAMGGDTGA